MSESIDSILTTEVTKVADSPAEVERIRELVLQELRIDDRSTLKDEIDSRAVEPVRGEIIKILERKEK